MKKIVCIILLLIHIPILNAKHIQNTKLFLYEQAQTDSSCKVLKTYPLHLAVMNKDHAEMLRLINDENACVDARDNRKWTPLHYAAYRGDYLAVIILTAHKANVNIKTPYNNTPLHFALEKLHIETIVTLIASPDIDIKQKNMDEVSPIMIVKGLPFPWLDNLFTLVENKKTKRIEKLFNFMLEHIINEDPNLQENLIAHLIDLLLIELL